MSLLSLFGDFKNFARWSVRGFCLMFFGGQTKKKQPFFSCSDEDFVDFQDNQFLPGLSQRMVFTFV